MVPWDETVPSEFGCSEPTGWHYTREQNIHRACFLGCAWPLLRSPRSREEGTKAELVASFLPSQGPTSGQNCYVTSLFSGVPSKVDKIQKGYLTPAFLGAHK